MDYRNERMEAKNSYVLEISIPFLLIIFVIIKCKEILIGIQLQLIKYCKMLLFNIFMPHDKNRNINLGLIPKNSIFIF